MADLITYFRLMRIVCIFAVPLCGSGRYICWGGEGGVSYVRRVRMFCI